MGHLFSLRQGDRPEMSGHGRARHRQRDEYSASFASHSRAAFSAIASSTGWISVGELAMTPRISLVAVCCSNASVRALVNKPRVLDRDHCLIGEGFKKFDLPV